MLVGRGALTFKTFQVSGKNPTPNHERVLERLEQFAFAGIDVQEEGSVHGWVAPDHLFDGAFDFPKIFRGRYALFAFRVDTRKVPGALLEAHTALAVAAACEEAGVERLPAKQKRDIKRDVKRQLLAETPPSQRAYGVFWNISARKVFLQASSKGVVEAFRALFERTFELNLEPQMPGMQAAAYAREAGLLQQLREARPLELAADAQALAMA